MEGTPMSENYNENEQKNNGTQNEEQNEYVYKSVMDGKAKSRVWSVASLIVACVSVLCCCAPWCAVVFGVFGIVFAIISRNSIGYFDGLAIAGLIVGIFGVVFGVGGFVLDYLVQNTDIFADFIAEYEKMYGEILGSQTP